MRAGCRGISNGDGCGDIDLMVERSGHEEQIDKPVAMCRVTARD